MAFEGLGEKLQETFKKLRGKGKITEKDIILRDEDNWIISRANTLVKEVGEDLEKLSFHKATRKINNFILEDLSRWYVRLIRGRTWVESDDPDKLGAYYSLYTAIYKLISVLCPIAPHVCEEIYENLVKGVDENAPESIHSPYHSPKYSQIPCTCNSTIAFFPSSESR